jgi:Bacterial extracellular solute-binding protein
MDLARLPNAIDVQPRFFVEGKGVGFFTYVTGLAYNTEIVKTPPTSWKDLWDPKYKGKIAIPPAGAGPALHMAIVAGAERSQRWNGSSTPPRSIADRSHSPRGSTVPLPSRGGRLRCSGRDRWPAWRSGVVANPHPP